MVNPEETRGNPTEPAARSRFWRSRPALASAAVLLAAVVIVGPAAAQNTNKRWSLHGNTGFQYDDNVTTNETDTTSNRSDTAAVIELGGTYRPAFGDGVNLELGYDFSQSLYEELDDFNLQSHTFSVSGDREVGGFDLGLNYLYGRTFLGGDDFLSLHSVTPTLGRSLTDIWYLSLRYNFLAKDFIQSANDPRDAFTNSLTFDNFIFFLKGSSYVSLGYRIEDENTDGPQFDYLGHFFHARLKLDVPGELWARWNPVFKAGIQYSLKDYSNVTPSIASERDDKRRTLSASLTVDVVDPVFARLSYENIHAISNLPSSDYNEQVVTFRVGFNL